MRQRLDYAMVERGVVASRSQAESYIKLGKVQINGTVVSRPAAIVDAAARIELLVSETYVSRAGLKLASIAHILGISFKGKTVLDVGSSTGGFTDYSLQHGAQKVIAVDVGTEQMHSSLRTDPRVELHEKTDMRSFRTDEHIDLVLADVSFISLRYILPAIALIIDSHAEVVVMVKPQFEAGVSGLMHKGVVKNDHMRREILKSFETWAGQFFLLRNKADSAVAGAKGNQERFYLLRKLK